MSFPRYPKYKDSGVEWLGEVPKHWEAKRIGYFFTERREKVSDKDFPALSVTQNGIVPQLETAAKTDDGDNRKKVCKGDFVINSRSDRKGSAGTSEFDGSVSLICTVLRAQEQVHTPFVHHLLRCQPFQEEFYRNGKGIVADLWSTNYSEMRNILLGMPPLTEQMVIATFLDSETNKIDELVAKQQRLIELLKEKRQAVISYAVTKGLNPDAPMKDSGIDWLGEVPEHWSVVPLKRVLEVKDGTHATPQYVDPAEGTFPLVTSKDFGETAICFDEAKHISTDDHFEVVKRSNTERGDVLMSMIGGNIGKALIVETERVFSIKNVALFKTFQSDYLAKYVLYYIQSGLLDIQIDLLSRGGAQGFLGLGDIRNLVFFKMPPAEMQRLVQNLESRLAPFGELIKAAEEYFMLMQERRSVLISAAVTGQIDVRGLVEKEAA